MSPGKLYILATPIGNMGDITLRAVETLKNVDYILSEDTRETGKLLKHFNIEKTQISYRDQNHDRVIEKILELINSGCDMALVSDSGTPVVSDPGFKLVEELSKQNIQIVPIPGPNAAISALSASGLPTDKFAFLGFLPKKDSHRKEILERYGKTDSTLIIYESPFRIKKLLNEINDTLGDRFVALARELTKIHEEIVRGNVTDIINSEIKEKGEFVVLVAKEGYGRN